MSFKQTRSPFYGNTKDDDSDKDYEPSSSSSYDEDDETMTTIVVLQKTKKPRGGNRRRPATKRKRTTTTTTTTRTAAAADDEDGRKDHRAKRQKRKNTNTKAKAKVCKRHIECDAWTEQPLKVDLEYISDLWSPLEAEGRGSESVENGTIAELKLRMETPSYFIGNLAYDELADMVDVLEDKSYEAGVALEKYEEKHAKEISKGILESRRERKLRLLKRSAFVLHHQSEYAKAARDFLEDQEAYPDYF